MDSPVLRASPPGIGDLCFLSPDWVAAARDALATIVTRRAAGLAEVPGELVVCEVGHNPPWHHSQYGEAYRTETKPYLAPLHGPGRVVFGTKLAWWFRIRGGSCESGEGELPAEECDLKLQGDHGIMSRMARLVRGGTDPALFEAAEQQLQPQSKWKVEGRDPAKLTHPAVAAALSELHDTLAPRTMARCVWMSPDWVAAAREIVTTRARAARLGGNPKYKPALESFRYVFAETFTDPPGYVSQDGGDCGFWVDFDHGEVTVGFGALPAERGKPDTLTKGQYIPTLGGGRTVNAALDEEEQKLVAEYTERRPATFNGKKTMEAVQRVSKGSAAMPAAMAVCMVALHDELSLRSSGEVPSDFDPGVQDGGAPPFDRHPEYSGTWLRYDRVDVYGRALVRSKL